MFMSVSVCCAFSYMHTITTLSSFNMFVHNKILKKTKKKKKKRTQTSLFVLREEEEEEKERRINKIIENKLQY